MNHILELENVSKQYKDGFLLDRVSFSLPYGSIMGFVGANGAGKTTTIGCILNTLRKDGGVIRLFGQEMADADTALRERIGVVCDGDAFPAYLTPEKLGGILQGTYARFDAALYGAHLRAFGLPPRQRVGALSKGMAMKLFIAAALAHHPELLILDEATSGLDPIVRDEMLDTFLDFVQDEKHAILMSSHITSDLERVADYIAFIHAGRILLTARKDDLIYRYGVLRCTADQFAALDAGDILAYRRRDYQTDVLVADREAAARRYPGVLAESAAIDEILLLLTKGERDR